MTTETFTVSQVADWVGGDVCGDGDRVLSGLAPFDAAGPTDLTFALDEKRLDAVADSQAGAVIVPADADLDVSVSLIRVEKVDHAIAALLAQFAPPPDLPEGVHPSAVIDPTATIGEEVAMGPNVVIGAGATIGPRTRICANVVIGKDVRIGEDAILFAGAVIETRCELGSRVRVGPNAVVGSEGFGYIQVDGVHQRVEHIGNAVLEDDVDLGACTCIDRAKFGSTRVARGSKLDNLIQIAHNVQVGPGSLLAAQVGIAGSTKLGSYVVIGGNAGLKDNITIGDGVQVAAFAAVANHVGPGLIVGGIPARPAGVFHRIVVAEAKLPQLIKRVKALEAKVKELG